MHVQLYRQYRLVPINRLGARTSPLKTHEDIYILNNVYNTRVYIYIYI